MSCASSPSTLTLLLYFTIFVLVVLDRVMITLLYCNHMPQVQYRVYFKRRRKMPRPRKAQCHQLPKIFYQEVKGFKDKTGMYMSSSPNVARA